jgi:hypothetical protein
MTTTSATAPTAATATVTTAGVGPASGTVRRPLVRPGLLASAGAAAATTGAAAIATASGIAFTDRTGAAIPLLGFTQLTLVCALAGVGLAALLARRARRPRRTFLRATTALVALSFVPDLASGFNGAATVTLVLIHLLAAAIVIPPLATRLAPRRPLK